MAAVRHRLPFLFALACLLAAGGGAWGAMTSAGAGGANKTGTLASVSAAVPGGSELMASTKPGFGCQTGSWGIQDGALTCVVSPPAAVSSIQSHWGFVNVLSSSGWTSSAAVQLVGEANDLRVDALTQSGNIIASCYIHALNAPCDVAGLAGSANSTYQAGKTMPNTVGSMLDAAGLISAAHGLGGSNVGTNGADNYVITAELDASNNIKVSIAGYFTYSATSSSTTLAPIFATITIPASTFASKANGSVYTATGVCQTSC